MLINFLIDSVKCSLIEFHGYWLLFVRGFQEEVKGGVCRHSKRTQSIVFNIFSLQHICNIEKGRIIDGR